MGPEVHNLRSQGFPLIARGTRLEVRKPFFAAVFFFYIRKQNAFIFIKRAIGGKAIV